MYFFNIFKSINIKTIEITNRRYASPANNIASLKCQNVNDLHVEDHSISYFVKETKFSREITSNKNNIQDVIV